MCHLSRTLSYILLISAIKNGKETNRPKLLLVSGIDVGPGKFGKRNKGPFKNYVDKMRLVGVQSNVHVCPRKVGR